MVSDGQCVAVGGPPFTILPPFTANGPIFSNVSEFLADVATSFITWGSRAGKATCSAGGVNLITGVPAASISSATASEGGPSTITTASLTNNGLNASNVSSQTSESSSGASLSSTARISIGVAVGVVFAIAAALGLVRLWQRRKRPDRPPKPSELDARRVESRNPFALEMPDDWPHPEIDGLAQSEMEEQSRHELPSREHAQELAT